ncbi:hypothetical protein CDN99_25095 [Roseateles aquatilis]|uniref:MmyB-like transcription regulator ligand binding domain-containing protein n=1 Tax=Roseateles aquatilis TaxID=431061 RepID=A0A246IVB3_9BURK|nr:helix-turn-helix domain-containing protein [Roseateles aquatilis]OWQ84158.1 hypothetical protein CDN99_25095 [Roseateles aquatilis]
MELAQLLKGARVSSGQSQLALAVRMGVSQRHVNFVEGARSRPSRVLLLDWLAQTDSPPSMFNAALRMAGYAALSDTDHVTPCESGCDTAVLRALDLHMPNPGFVFDADWRVMRFNASALWLIDQVMPDLAPTTPGERLDMIAALASPRGWLSRVHRPVEVGAALLAQLRAEQWSRPALAPRVDALETALRERFGDDVLRSSRAPTTTYLDLVLETDLGPLSFSVLQSWTGLPTDQDATSSRAELWFPTDDGTAAVVREAMG